MPYQLPSVPDFKQQFVRDFPYGVPLGAPGAGNGAVVTVTANGPNQSIDTAVVTAGGSGYPPSPVPDIILLYGGGVGALLSAQMAAGVMTGVQRLSNGYGYGTPSNLVVYISPGTGDNTSRTKVSDFDIAAALGKAINFNTSQGLFGSQAAFTSAYNLLAAHYLCLAMRAAGAGLGGVASWLETGKVVGDVSSSFQIPDRILHSPFLSKLSATTYGAQFLELVSPSLVGNVASYHRNTLP